MKLSIRVAAALCACVLPGPADAAGVTGAPDRKHYQPYPELEGKPVRRVVVLGNNRTREIVFRREMRLTEGEPFRAHDLWRDWERIVDLGIFAGVEVEAVPSGDGVLVVVEVHERPSWFAAPVANYHLTRRTFWVGYRSRLRNLDGLNRTFSSNARFGDENRFSISWETPWLGDTRQALRLGADVELPRPDAEELRTSGVHVSTTRFLGDYKRTRMGVTAFTRLELLERDETHPAGGVRELSPVLGIGWVRDQRNVRIDPTRGTFASALGEIVSGWTADDLRYGRTSLDGRGFLSVGRGVVLATRATTILTTGEIPDYRRLGVGGDGSIRGHPANVEIGANLALASAEIRFPILGRRRFGLPIPFLPRKISNVDFRVDGEFFVDAGTAWDDSEDLRTARVRTGAGFGLRVFLPILELARFEVAFDPSGKPQLYVSEGNVI